MNGLRTNRDRQALYPPGSLGAPYMTAEGLCYAQPWFHITVNSITVPDDPQTVAAYSFAEDLDQLLARNRTEETHG